MEEKLALEVMNDLEARGAKIIANCIAYKNPDGTVFYDFQSIKVTFPTGRKWDIISIKEEKE